jgi:hypothetical protein
MKRLTLLTLALALALSALPAYGQDRHGEIVTDAPEYNGTTAAAPIPPELHIRNEGGSDDAGLCVIASLVINGAYQGVPGLEGLKDSALWRTAKSRPGGYYPEKLERLLHELYPDEQWISWEGDGTDLLQHYASQGYPIAATMKTGALYGYKPIHHMISLVHLDENLACVVDNNDPGKYHWMPAAEYARRFTDGPKGWGVVWLRRPGGDLPGGVSTLEVCLLLGSGLLLLATLSFSTSPSPSHAPPQESLS